MNIQKTNMLLLDNRIKLKENEPAPVVNTVSQGTDAKNGMRALMFQGQQNYLNSQVAFQGGMKQKVGTYLAAGLMAVAALGMTSCKNSDSVKESDRITNISIENNVTVDMSMLQALLDELKGLRQDNADYKAELQTIINMFQSFIDMYKNNQATDDAFKNEIINNQNTIISLLEMQGLNHNEAVALLNQILNSNMTMSELLANIKGLVADIKSQLNTIIANQEEAAEDRKALLEYAEGTYVNSNTLIYIGEQSLKSDSIRNAELDLILKKIDAMNIDMNANSEALSEQLGVQHQQMVKLLINMGYTMAQIEKMTAAEIIKAIKENTQVAKSSDTKLAQIIEMLKDGRLSAEEAAAKIIELLSNIDANVSSILDTVNNLYKAYLEEAKKNDAFRINMIKNGRINNELLNKIYIDGQYRNKLLYENNQTLNVMNEKLNITNGKLDSLIVLGNEKPDMLVDVINAAITKGDEIITSIEGITVNMNADDIIKAIKEFQNTYVTTEAQKIVLQKEANELLATYLPLLKNISGDNTAVLAKLEELANLIKANTVAINNNTTSAADASAKELEAQKEANELLKQLIAKADAILAKMDANATAAQKYYNNMEAKFDEIKPLIKELDSKLYTIIAKMNTVISQGEKLKPVVDEILVEVKNLETIAGGALTKDELDQVMNKYGDDLKVLLNSLHADTAADLDKINKNIEKGNKIKQEILDEIKKHAGDSDILAQIKNILETKDFCHCTCTDKDVDNNEGILEEIKDITG